MTGITEVERVEEKQAQSREDGYCCRKTVVLMPNVCQPWMIEVRRTQVSSLLFYISTWVGLCSVAKGRENATYSITAARSLV